MQTGLVQFIFVFDEKKDAYKPIGSGFVVDYRDSDFSYSWTYLVTCRHVVEGNMDNNRPMFIRLSSFDGIGSNSRKIDSDYFEFDNNWVFHREDSVDIAVATLPSPRHATGKVFGYSMKRFEQQSDNSWSLEFADEDEALPVGLDIHHAGLFHIYFGKTHNEPISRFGKVALEPSERIMDDNSGFGYDFLIESQAYFGSSGSPVFANLAREMTDGSVIKMSDLIVGVVGVAYPSSIKETILPHNIGFSVFSQMGITGVTHAKYIRQIIEGEGMRNVRKNFVSRMRNPKRTN